jgi:hypothetical protein
MGPRASLGSLCPRGSGTRRMTPGSSISAMTRNHSAFISTVGATKAVTRALKRKDGQLAMLVEESRLG